MHAFLSWHTEEQMRPFLHVSNFMGKVVGSKTANTSWRQCNAGNASAFGTCVTLTLFHRVVKAAPERRDGLLHLALLQGLGKKAKYDTFPQKRNVFFFAHLPNLLVIVVVYRVDVLPHRSVEEHGVLGDDGQLGPIGMAITAFWLKFLLLFGYIGYSISKIIGRRHSSYIRQHHNPKHWLMTCMV